jgi:iron complex outermembrane receptor protein
MKIKSYALITTALTGVMIAGGAYAQNNKAPAADKKDDSQEVVVVGVRKSLQKSLDVKRKATAHIDVITAEDVSKFPDVNVAESLSRLPGITIDRTGGGEGNKVAINGVDSRLVVVELNGNPIATATAGANNHDTGRSFDFTNLAPELIGNVEVYKTPEARLDEGAVGGTIILNTLKPLSLPRNTVSANISYNINERNKKKDPRYSFVYSTKDDSGRFGFIVNYDYNKSELGSGDIQASYQPVCSAAHWGGCNSAGTAFSTPSSLPTVSSGPALTTNMLVPQYIALSSLTELHERKSLFVDFQIRPTDNLDFNVYGINVTDNDSSFNQWFQTDLSVNWNEGNPYYASTSNFNTKMSSVTTNSSGVTGGTGTFAVRQDEYYKHTIINTKGLYVDGKWTPGAWTITGSIGDTKATGGSNPEYYLSFYGYDSGSWSMSPNGASLHLDKPATDPTLFATRAKGNQAGFVKTAVALDQFDYLKFDVKRDVEWGPIDTIQFGAKWQKHLSINKPHFYNTTFNVTGTMANFPTYLSDPALVKGLGASGDLLSYVGMTQQAVADYSIANKSSGNATSDYRDAGNLWDTSETVNDAYVEATFRAGKWHGDAGVRYAKTENKQTYRSTMDYYPWDEEMITLDKSYHDILPSFNAIYDLTDDMLLRFSAAKVMSRPTFADMSGQIEYSLDRYSAADGHFGGHGGNPDLKPYRAVNYSASYEWYFAPNSLFNVDLIYKDIQSYIVQKYIFTNVTLPGADAIAYCTDTVNRLAGKPTFDARTTACGNVENMLVNSSFNGSNAKIPGISVGYQGNLPYGFGIQANATFLDQQYQSYTDAYNKSGGKLALPYLSKWSYTVSPYYEKGAWQARVSYTYRTKYNVTLGNDLVPPSNVDGWGQLDASASYKVNSHISLNVAAQNLLDGEQHPYTTGGLPLSWSKYGTRVVFGVSFKN